VLDVKINNVSLVICNRVNFCSYYEVRKTLDNVDCIEMIGDARFLDTFHVHRVWLVLC